MNHRIYCLFGIFLFVLDFAIFFPLHEKIGSGQYGRSDMWVIRKFPIIFFSKPIRESYGIYVSGCSFLVSKSTEVRFGHKFMICQLRSKILRTILTNKTSQYIDGKLVFVPFVDFPTGTPENLALADAVQGSAYVRNIFGRDIFPSFWKDEFLDTARFVGILEGRALFRGYCHDCFFAHPFRAQQFNNGNAAYPKVEEMDID